MAISKDYVKNLQTLSLFISMDVGNAMMAAYMTRVADRWFYQYSEEEQRKRFRTNPANTLTYQSLYALFERSVVHISEWLKDEEKLHPVPDEIRQKLNKLDLGLHRNAISHPATINWRDPRMQEFADADRGWNEYRPALVWDANRSINEELRKGGHELRNESITVTWEMAVLLRDILEMSVRVESVQPPSREQLFAYLQENAAKYQAQLEKHPDGGRNPLKEKERAAKKREKWVQRRKKWSGRQEQSPDAVWWRSHLSCLLYARGQLGRASVSECHRRVPRSTVPLVELDACDDHVRPRDELESCRPPMKAVGLGLKLNVQCLPRRTISDNSRSGWVIRKAAFRRGIIIVGRGVVRRYGRHCGRQPGDARPRVHIRNARSVRSCVQIVQGLFQRCTRPTREQTCGGRYAAKAAPTGDPDGTSRLR